MALSDQIINLVRDEIGDDKDFVDADTDLPGIPPAFDSLENIYTDIERGNSSTLNTALVVWRRRLGNHQAHAFDIAKEGNWLARSQLTKYLQSQVLKYERLTGQKATGRNDKIQSEAEDQGLVSA